MEWTEWQPSNPRKLIISRHTLPAMRLHAIPVPNDQQNAVVRWRSRRLLQPHGSVLLFAACLAGMRTGFDVRGSSLGMRAEPGPGPRADPRARGAQTAALAQVRVQESAMLLRIRGGIGAGADDDCDVLLADPDVRGQQEDGEVYSEYVPGEEYGSQFGEEFFVDGNEDTVVELRAELDAVERELEDAQDARAVAEQVNVRLKSAMEDQSLEIVRLRGLLGSLGVNASGDWTTPANDESRRMDAEQAHADEVINLREMLASKMAHAKSLVLEKERFENDAQAAQREAASLRKMLSRVQWDLDRVRRAGGEGVALVYRCKQELNRLALEVTELRADNQRLVDSRREDEMMRRQLHNQVQQLKGNIRVYCRIRPLLGTAELRSAPVMTTTARSPLETSETLRVAAPKGDTAFSFDRVFGAASTQADVFDEISALVQSALDGFRVCIFAYGQTGSGKTYTMSGPPAYGLAGGETEEEEGAATRNEDRGMIPRAVEMIFAQVESLRIKGWEYEIAVSHLEIYNENIRDLLAPPLSAGQPAPKLDIKHVDGMAAVTNLRVVNVESENQVQDLLSQALEARATAATQHNEASSRSHAVFCMYIHGRHRSSGETVAGALNLVDLAGSERLAPRATSQAGLRGEGDRVKETTSINKSLSSLCDVMSALANNERHVPYRNSKLTYLLQVRV